MNQWFNEAPLFLRGWAALSEAEGSWSWWSAGLSPEEAPATPRGSEDVLSPKPSPRPRGPAYQGPRWVCCTPGRGRQPRLPSVLPPRGREPSKARLAGQGGTEGEQNHSATGRGETGLWRVSGGLAQPLCSVLEPREQGVCAPESRLWESRRSGLGVSCRLLLPLPTSGPLVKACVPQSRV